MTTRVTREACNQPRRSRGGRGSRHVRSRCMTPRCGAIWQQCCRKSMWALSRVVRSFEPYGQDSFRFFHSHPHPGPFDAACGVARDRLGPGSTRPQRSDKSLLPNPLSPGGPRHEAGVTVRIQATSPPLSRPCGRAGRWGRGSAPRRRRGGSSARPPRGRPRRGAANRRRARRCARSGTSPCWRRRSRDRH